MKAAKKQTVKTDAGRKYPLVVREVIGEEPCPGEAHSNAFIDNCGCCLNHRWGFVHTYAPVDVVEATKLGYAVPVSYVERSDREVIEAGGITMVHVTQRYPSGSLCSYYAYVAL